MAKVLYDSLASKFPDAAEKDILKVGRDSAIIYRDLTSPDLVCKKKKSQGKILQYCEH